MLEVVKLNSGVRLIFNKVDSVRSISLGVWCNNGSVNESEPLQGISHFIEHMLFKGTKNRTAFEIVHEIDKLGGQMNAFTGKEATCFYVKCLDEHFKESADVLTDMISHPLFDKDEIEKEKLVIVEEINMNADDPDDVALENLEKSIYKGMGMAHPVLGTKDTVSSFTQEILNEYYYSHYTRDEIVVSIAGSFNREEIISYFENCFLNLRPARNDNQIQADVQDNKAEHIEIHKDIEQAHIAMGIKLFDANDERRYPMALLSNILGGGMSSRLFQNVREKKGLAYSVYSMTGFYRNTGLFVIAAGIAKDRVDEAMEAIKIELERLQDNDITAEEFNSSKEQLKSSFIFGQESVQSLMVYNGRTLLTIGRCISPSEMLEKLDNITLDDIKDIQKLISDFDRFTIVNVTGNN